MELMTSPFPPIKGRPLYIEHEGGKVFLLYRDHLFLATRTKLRKEIINAHPDHGGTRSKLETVMARYRAWFRKEKKWYAQYGITPPGGKGTSSYVCSPSSIQPRQKPLHVHMVWTHIQRSGWRRQGKSSSPSHQESPAEVPSTRKLSTSGSKSPTTKEIVCGATPPPVETK